MNNCTALNELVEGLETSLPILEVIGYVGVALLVIVFVMFKILKGQING